MSANTYCKVVSLLELLSSHDVNYCMLFPALLTLGTKGYGSRFVVRSFVRSVHCATESSAHFFAPVKVRTG